MRIAIVGAGVSGLALAAGLDSRDHDFTIFEKDSVIRGLGTGLTLWPNATRVLQSLEILEVCESKGGPLRNLFVQLSDGSPVMSIPVEEFETPAFAMNRGPLHEALLSKINQNRIVTSAAVQEILEENNCYWLLVNGTKLGPFDLVVGADGIHSKVREFVRSQTGLRYRGYKIWRGVADSTDLIQPNGNFYEIWGKGSRFGILPMGEHQVCWYSAINHPLSVRFGTSEQKEYLERFYSGWSSPVPEIIHRTLAKDIIAANASDIDPNQVWSKGGVLLLGDAVHATVANLGMGACLALEDAGVLARLLKSKPGVQELCRGFKALRKKRVASIIKRSRFLGQIGQLSRFAGPRNFVAKRVPGRLFMLTSRSLHSYDFNLEG